MAWREELTVGELQLVSPAGVVVTVFAHDGTPTDGTSGTKAGRAGPGSMCIDATNGIWYRNMNTKASPLWTLTGIQTT